MAKHYGTNEPDSSAKNCSVAEHKLMLSYARIDAKDYAGQLYRELRSLQFENVFLDTERIVGGDQWVIELNNAVLNCNVFIALVTPNYGMTKWTLREFNMADNKDKLIIPINFLEKWPPDCLAIVLLSIQFIPWNSDARKTAIDIKNILQKRLPILNPRSPDNPLDGFNSSLGLPDKSVITDKTIKMKPKIVISAHPHQMKFTQFLRINLSEKFEFKFWCSLDVSAGSQTKDDQRLAKDFKSEAKSGETLFIIVLSKSYCSSKTCKQQAFYCGFREKVVPIKYEEFDKPEWMSQLFTEDIMRKPIPWLSYDDNDPDSFIKVLNQRVSELFNIMESFDNRFEMGAHSIGENQSRFYSSK